MNKNSTSLTLYPRRWRMILGLIFSLLFSVLSIWLINDGASMGWATLALFIICSIISIIALMPGSAYLRISKKGFETRSLFRSRLTGWDEIERFNTEDNKIVIYNYNQKNHVHKSVEKVSKSVFGFEEMLPDTYGKSAEELANLLNDWKEKSDSITNMARAI